MPLIHLLVFLFWAAGFLTFVLWPVSLSVAAAFATYAWIQWQGTRWKIAAIVPALMILARRMVPFREEGQLGPVAQLFSAEAALVLYCVGLSVARFLRRT